MKNILASQESVKSAHLDNLIQIESLIVVHLAQTMINCDNTLHFIIFSSTPRPNNDEL
jgi:hypothetical protein